MENLQMAKRWDVFIANSVWEIQLLNRRRKGGGNYLDQEDLKESVEDAFSLAIIKAELEVFKGKLSPQEVAAQVDKDALIQQALDLIKSSN